MDDDIEESMHRAREPVDQGTCFTNTQKDEFPFWGAGVASYTMSSTSASVGRRHWDVESGSSSLDWSSNYERPTVDDSKFYPSSASSNFASGGDSRFNTSNNREHDMQSIPGLGDYDYEGSDKPVASTESSRPKHTSESAANILLRYGLEKEDLDHLIFYPEDQLTPDNLPFILRQIRIQKAKSATTAVQSVPYPEPQPTRSVSGMDSHSLSSSRGAGMRQEERSIAVLQPSKVIDYGNTGKYTGGVGDEIGMTSGSRSNSGGRGSTFLMDAFNSSSHIREPLLKNTTEVKSSALGSSRDQASSVTSLGSSYSSVLSAVAPPSNDPNKRLQTSQTILSLFSLPKKDTDIRVLKPEASKPGPLKEPQADRQSALKTQPPCSLLRGVHPSQPDLVLVGSNDPHGAKNQSKTQGQRSTVAEQMKKQQTQQTQKQPSLQTGQEIRPPVFPAAKSVPPDHLIPIITDVSQAMQRPVFIRGDPRPIPAQAIPGLNFNHVMLPTSHTQLPAKVGVSKALPTPSMMQDYAAASPEIFPHTCSLCNKEFNHMKDWLSHQNTSFHLESCKLLRKQYPEWDGAIALGPRAAHKDAKPSASTSAHTFRHRHQITRHGRGSRSSCSSSPSPRCHRRRRHGLEGRSEQHSSRSRSTHSPRYSRRSRSHSPLYEPPHSSHYHSRSRSPERRSSPRRNCERLLPRKRSDGRRSPPGRSNERRSPPWRSNWRQSPPKWSMERGSPPRWSEERGLPPKRSNRRRSAPRWSDDRRSSPKRSVKRFSPPRWSKERQSLSRTSEESRSPPRWSEERQTPPWRSNKRQLPSSRRRSSTEDSSPQRKKSSSAERLAEELLETSAVQSLSMQSDLEAMVKALVPALLAKMKSSSSSPSPCKAKPSLQKKVASSATKTKSGKPSPPTMVRLKGISTSVSCSDVIVAVEHFGKTKSVVLFRSRLEAIVCFEKEEDANKLKSVRSLTVKGTEITVIRKKETDSKEQKQPPQKEPATFSVFTPQTTTSTTTARKVLLPTRSMRPRKWPLPWGSRIATTCKLTHQKIAAKGSVKGRTVMKSVACVSKVRNFSTNQVAITAKTGNLSSAKQAVKKPKNSTEAAVEAELPSGGMERKTVQKVKSHTASAKDASVPTEPTAVAVREQQLAASTSFPAVTPLTFGEMVEKHLDINVMKCYRHFSSQKQLLITGLPRYHDGCYTEDELAKLLVPFGFQHKDDTIYVVPQMCMKASGSMFPIIMLTSLPEGNYQHEDVAKLVWRYFPKQNLHSLDYSVMVLTLQRRAFVFFADWTTCCNFVRDHLKKTVFIKNYNPCVHFVLQHMNPESSEEMMYRSLIKWSNAGVPELKSLEERLLCVEISATSVAVVRTVMEVVASIAPIVSFLPLANRICIEMADSSGVTQAVEKYNTFSPDSLNRLTAWRSKVKRFETLKSLKQRLQDSSEITINFEPDTISVASKPPAVKYQTRPSELSDTGSQAALQTSGTGGSIISEPITAGPSATATSDVAVEEDIRCSNPVTAVQTQTDAASSKNASVPAEPTAAAMMEHLPAVPTPSFEVTPLTVAEMVEKPLDPKKIECLKYDTQLSRNCLQLGLRLLLITRLPRYHDALYTEDEFVKLLKPFGFEHKDDTIYVVPQDCMAFVMMPTAKSAFYIAEFSIRKGLYFKGSKLWFQVVSSGVQMTPPLEFYKSLMMTMDSLWVDDGVRTVFIKNVKQSETRDLREALKKVSSVKNYLPLLNKVFVEFVFNRDADRLGVWYSLLKQAPRHEVQRLTKPNTGYSSLPPRFPENALPDSKDIVAGVTIPPIKNVPQGSISPFWVTLKTRPFLFPTMSPWFIIPDYLTVKGQDDIEKASGSKFPTIMLTGLPEENYQHEDVAKLVWRYFPKQNLRSLYYNVTVLSLQRRAFVFFADWTTCCNFARDHITNPVSVKGSKLSVHFVLQHMNPASTEDMMYRSLMKWSNAGVSEPMSLEERLLCVEISETSGEVIKKVMDVVDSIATFVSFLPLANRICIEMADSSGVAKVVKKYNTLSLDSSKRCTTWWSKVKHFETLKSLKQRLQDSSEITINFEPVSLEAKSPAVKYLTQLHPPKLLDSGSRAALQTSGPGTLSAIIFPSSLGQKTLQERTKSPAKASNTASSSRKTHSPLAGSKTENKTAAAIVNGSMETHLEPLREETQDTESEVAKSDHKVSAEGIAAKTGESQTKIESSSEMRPPPQGHEVELSQAQSLDADCNVNTLKDQKTRKQEGKEDVDKHSEVEEDDRENFQILDSLDDQTDEQMDDGDQHGSSETQLTGPEGSQTLHEEKGIFHLEEDSEMETTRSLQVLDSVTEDQAAAGQEDSHLVQDDGSVKQLSEEDANPVVDKSDDAVKDAVGKETDNKEQFQVLVTGSKQGPKGDGKKKEQKEEEVKVKTLSAESSKTSKDVENPDGRIPNEDQLLQECDSKDNLKGPASDVTEEETFEMLDSINDQTATLDDNQKHETPSEQISKEYIRPEGEEEDTDLVTDTVKDQPMKSEVDDKEKSTKKEEATPRKDERQSKRSDPATSASKSEEKEKSQDKMVKKYETQTKMGTSAAVSKKDKEVTEEVVYEVVDSVENEVYRDASATERSGRRRSARGKKVNENADDELTIMRRSTRVKRERTTNKDASIEKTQKEDTPTRRRHAPARESQERSREKTPKREAKVPLKESTPTKKDIAARKVSEDDANCEISSMEDGVVKHDQPATGGGVKGKRGRPKKPVQTTKKDKVTLKADEDSSEKVADEAEATYLTLNSVEKRKVDDQLPTGQSAKRKHVNDSEESMNFVTVDEVGEVELEEEEEEKVVTPRTRGRTKKRSRQTPAVSKQRAELVEPETKRSCSRSHCVSADYKLPAFKPNNPLGQDFVVPTSGYFCNLCFDFYKSTAKDLHCSSQRHYDNLQKHYQKLQQKPSRCSTQSAQGSVSE